MAMSMVMSQRKKPRGGNEEANQSRLPDLILFEKILTRLPAKTLLRFKSVSKHWCSTIHSPSFTRVHHARAQTRPDGGCLAISMAMPKGSSFETNLFTAGYEGGQASHLLSSREYCCSISTHGLILLSHNDMFKVFRPVFIYNPTTKELISLPPISNYIDEPCYDSISADYSLGYDPLTGQYKVLAMCTLCKTDEIVEDKYCLFIFTLGTESWTWRKGTFLTPSRIDSSSACCLNGALHWLVRGPDVDINNAFGFILAFDVGKEKFRILLLSGRPASLGLLTEVGDRLALMSDHELDGNRVPEVWVLEDYDKGEWMKVKLETPSLQSDHETNLFEVRAIQAGEKFLVTPRRKQMTEYLWGCYCDKSGKECSAFKVTGLPVDIEFLHAMVHLKVSNNVETLFSPRAGHPSNNSADSKCSMFGLYLH